MPAQTSRQIVRTGIAQFFGGPIYDSEARAYRGSIPAPLLAAGLSTVRPYQPKRISDKDYVKGQAAGRGMGAAMAVGMARDQEIRRALPAAGPGTGYVAAGRKRITYATTLNIFHLAHMQHAEDAEADVDGLVEAVKNAIRGDVTLGSIPGVYQAGESSRGITVQISESMADKEIVGTYVTVTFDVEAEIVA